MSKPDVGKAVAMSQAVVRINEMCRQLDMRFEANGKSATASKAFQNVITLTGSATKDLDVVRCGLGRCHGNRRLSGSSLFDNQQRRKEMILWTKRE